MSYPAERALMDTFMLGLFVGFLLASWWERYRERRKKPSGKFDLVTGQWLPAREIVER
jgi:hypothetical protein